MAYIEYGTEHSLPPHFAAVHLHLFVFVFIHPFSYVMSLTLFLPPSLSLSLFNFLVLFLWHKCMYENQVYISGIMNGVL